MVGLGRDAHLQCISGLDDVHGDEGRVSGCGWSAAARGGAEQEAGEDGEEGGSEDAVPMIERCGMGRKQMHRYLTVI
jgi:hypothetical protein